MPMGDLMPWPSCSVSHFRQVLDHYQTILTCERKGLVGPLRLGHAEDSMVTGIVNFYVLAVFDY